MCLQGMYDMLAAYEQKVCVLMFVPNCLCVCVLRHVCACINSCVVGSKNSKEVQVCYVWHECNVC